MQLNKNQQKACEHFMGPAMVIAGAGSGKTHVLTSRIEYLIKKMGVSPKSILAITFTNYAANQMEERLLKKNIVGPLVCTFHKLGLKILRKTCSKEHFKKTLCRDQNFVIYDNKESFKVIKNILLENRSDISLSSCIESISKIKNGKKTTCPEIINIYNQYEKKLIQNNAFDLDDLCLKTLEVVEKNEYDQSIFNWDFICVDEFQDTSIIQAKIAKQISSKNKNLFVVGDPDQSIYSWRGANIRNIMSLPDEIKGIKTITLDQNYRSCNTILEASNNVISNNTKRFSKSLWSKINESKHINICSCKNDIYEARLIVKKIYEMNLQDVSILYRASSISRAIEDTLIEEKIAYKVLGNIMFYDRKEIKDVMAYLKTSVNPKDSQSIYRILKNNVGFGVKFISSLQKLSKENNLDMFKALEQSIFEIKTNEKQKQSITKICHLINELKNTIKASSCITKIIDSGLICIEEPIKERQENINELLSKAINSNVNTIDFIDQTLIGTSSNEDSNNVVKLMTIHHAKGAEFENVFIVGCEEGIFPHSISSHDEEQMEEERRLFYVAMTRAKKNVFITFSNKRIVWGQKKSCEPSRFICEIPQNLINFEFYPQCF